MKIIFKKGITLEINDNNPVNDLFNQVYKLIDNSYIINKYNSIEDMISEINIIMYKACLGYINNKVFDKRYNGMPVYFNQHYYSYIRGYCKSIYKKQKRYSSNFVYNEITIENESIENLLDCCETKQDFNNLYTTLGIE